MEEIIQKLRDLRDETLCREDAIWEEYPNIANDIFKEKIFGSNKNCGCEKFDEIIDDLTNY